MPVFQLNSAVIGLCKTEPKLLCFFYVVSILYPAAAGCWECTSDFGVWGSWFCCSNFSLPSDFVERLCNLLLSRADLTRNNLHIYMYIVMCSRVWVVKRTLAHSELCCFGAITGLIKVKSHTRVLNCWVQGHGWGSWSRDLFQCWFSLCLMWQWRWNCKVHVHISSFQYTLNLNCAPTKCSSNCFWFMLGNAM